MATINIYGDSKSEALKRVMEGYGFSGSYDINIDSVKAAIMKQTLIHNYEDVRFWSGVSLPELPEGEFTIEEFEEEIKCLHFEWQDLQDLQDLPDSELSDLERSDIKKYDSLCKRLEESNNKTDKYFEDFIASLSKEDLIEIFDNMDHRFNTWATPPRAMIREMNA